MIDQETIKKANADIVGVLGRYNIKLQKKGGELHALCPFHNEKSPSFTVKPADGYYYCFGCGASGNAITFVMEIENIGFRDAVEKITGNLPADFDAEKSRASYKTEQADEWVPELVVPASAPTPPSVKWMAAPSGSRIPKSSNTFVGSGGDLLVKHEAVARYPYHNIDGSIAGYTLRFNCAWGGKDIIPQTWCKNTKSGEFQWRWLSLPKPRVMYHLDKLSKHPNAQVVMAEGEKACDAAQSLYEAIGINRDRLIVLSWAGGGKAVKHTDWSPLAGRSVGFWPDADKQVHPQTGDLVPYLNQPGVACMLDIASRIQNPKKMQIFVPPEGVPDGWDLADALPEGFDLLAHTKSSSMAIPDFIARFTPAPVVAPPPAPAPEPVVVVELPPVIDEPEEYEEDLIQNSEFTVLGYDGDDYYFFHHKKKQVLRRTKGDFSETGLNELADINWWESNFPAKDGFNRRAAVDWIFKIANSRGIYDPTKVRGRGAWLDKGRIVFHHGKHLSINGAYSDITAIKSAYVYPLARSMPDMLEPLSDEEGKHLVRVAMMPRWSMPGSAALMAGWAMLAPICGALTWRPHIWLTGAAGSGKAQPHSSKVLTPSGWRLMGDICVGDMVTTPDDKYGRVLGVFPQGNKPVYKLTFADGRSTRATSDHLWKVRLGSCWKIRTTEQMIGILSTETRQSVSLAIPLSEAVSITSDRPKQVLPLHPYVLGVLLGDGHLANDEKYNSGTIGLACWDQEIVDRVRLLVPDWMGLFEATTRKHHYRFGDLSRYGKKTRLLIKELRILGTRSHNKFIPLDYLNASVEDRWDLLSGLMDTDGTIGSGSLSYCTVSKQLADDVAYLVRSLGGIALVSEKNTTYTYLNEKKSGLLAYNISIRFPDRSKVFTLPRKACLANKDYQYSDCLYLNVKSIELDGDEDCSCIMIDHPDRLYITDDFVVTHNTSIQLKYCGGLTRGISVYANGNSTEAGIRQELKCDARPVMVDEFESNNEREKQRVENVMSLIRQTSSETQAKTYKGTASGTGMQFDVRSMFCLASINTNLPTKADIDRLSILSLKTTRNESQNHWPELEAELNRIDEDATLAGRLLSRCLTMMPVILASIKVFRRVAATAFKSQRDGDQYGTLIAGCWCLAKHHVPSDEEALALIGHYDWSQHREGSEEDDAMRALEAILSAKLKVQLVGELSVYELIRELMPDHRRDLVSPAIADATLKRHGIRVEKEIGQVWFGSSVSSLKSLVEKMSFVTDLRGQLLRVKGAERIDTNKKFNGVDSKVVAVPLWPIFAAEATGDADFDNVPF